MYTPLSSRPYTPGINADVWLLGITFVEISAVTAAIEIFVSILRRRPDPSILTDSTAPIDSISPENITFHHEVSSIPLYPKRPQTRKKRFSGT